MAVEVTVLAPTRFIRHISWNITPTFDFVFNVDFIILIVYSYAWKATRYFVVRAKKALLISVAFMVTELKIKAEST